MIHPIVLYGDPVLKKRAATIGKGDIDLEELIQDMFETMEAANGVGLAAPQIGKSVRLFVIDTTPIEKNPEDGLRKVFINPEIVDEDGEEWAFEEGCLSIPGIREDVVRHERILIRYQDENWEAHEESLTGMAARVVQHEFDHIEGVLFTDHLSVFKKRLIKNKLANISKGKVSAEYRVRVPLRK
jgi:peptide deformylase